MKLRIYGPQMVKDNLTNKNSTKANLSSVILIPVSATAISAAGTTLILLLSIQPATVIAAAIPLAVKL